MMEKDKYNIFKQKIILKTEVINFSIFNVALKYLKRKTCMLLVNKMKMQIKIYCSNANSFVLV